MTFDNWKRLPDWIKTNKFYKKDLVNGGESKEVTPLEANLVSSEIYTDANGVTWHYPIIDLDIDHHLEPSSTPGHGHLFIGKPVPHEGYGEILRVLNKWGIVQDGIIEKQYEAEGFTAARLPGIKKEPGSLSSGSSKENKTKQIMNSEKVSNDDWTNIELIAEGELEVVSSKLSGISSSIGTHSNVSYKPEDLTDELKPAMLMFEHVANIASKYGHSLKETTAEWIKFVSAMSDAHDKLSQNKPTSQSKTVLPPASPDTVNW